LFIVIVVVALLCMRGAPSMTLSGLRRRGEVGANTWTEVEATRV